MDMKVKPKLSTTHKADRTIGNAMYCKVLSIAISSLIDSLYSEDIINLSEYLDKHPDIDTLDLPHINEWFISKQYNTDYLESIVNELKATH